MAAIKRLLIANRGEIAVRIMRTAKARGIHCIAVYSDADANALHVKSADDAVHLGGAAAADSYLAIDKIIAAAKASEADAIHPGYGFLSERAEFAAACEDAGIIFVGPSASAIDLMGDKARAKRAMIEAGVPCVPGYQGEAQDDATLIAEGKAVGFPLMVKAAAGGGGKGMRLVEGETDLPQAISNARSEAEAAFGSGDLILEKAIIQPRHAEIQVFGDSHGNVIHLGERDCSVQRRHQKVIEEAPCPVMTDQLRVQMGDAAVKAARSVDYVGAGTVEFLLGKDGEFYFLEMNTRLQVEHPVTEEVTGLDLVAMQLQVAEGEALPLTQDEVCITGHSIEVRFYAEDPARDFLPGAGKVALWHVPDGEGEIDGLRVDAGIETGGDVSAYYDPMVAKIIATAPTRDDARRKLVQALRGSALIGPANNRDFLIDLLEHKTFAAGLATTGFIAEAFGSDGWSRETDDEAVMLAATVVHALRASAASEAAIVNREELAGWSSSGRLLSIVEFAGEEGVSQIRIECAPDGSLLAHDGENSGQYRVLELDGSQAFVAGPKARHRLHFNLSRSDFTLVAPHGQFAFKLHQPGASDDDEAGSGRITAPMHGKLVSMLVAIGDAVERGQGVAVMEAMKMQQEIVAPISGTVTHIGAGDGAQLAIGDLVLEIEGEDEE